MGFYYYFIIRKNGGRVVDMKEVKKITIAIPARNEEKFIGHCLDSLLLQTHPKELTEIIIVDGASADHTKQVALEYAKKYPFIKVLDNPKKYTPYSMNIGVKNATGDAVTIGGAHSTYEKDYLEKCVRYLNEYPDAANVGGGIRTTPSRDTLTAKGIVAALSSFFGAGNSLFRTGITTPTWADTVFGGCFRKELFEEVGYFNEHLTRSQDMEFNIRLKKAEKKILLVPDIVSIYHPKATFWSFFIHNLKDGIWAILPMKYGARMFKLRHLLPFFFVAGLIGSLLLSLLVPFFIYFFYIGLGLWILAALYFSVKISLREKTIVLLPFIFIAFAVRHFGYGLGSIVGFIRLITG